MLKILAFQVKNQRTFWKGVGAIVSSKLNRLQHNLLLNFASLFKHTPVFKTKTIIRQELIKCEQNSFFNANPAEELCSCLLMLLLKQSKLLHKRIALAKHEFCQNQLFPSSWSEDHDIMKKAIVQKRQITLLRKKVEQIMAKSWIWLKTCSMMMKFVQLVKEAVKLLRSNFGISIKLLKFALQSFKIFPKISFFANPALQKTTWVLEWFPYVERVFLRIVGGKI